MRQRDVWRDVLPVEETQMAAEYLVKIWNQIARSQSNRVRYSVPEPKLTERLHFYMDKLRGESGLIGYWVNQPEKAFYDENGNLIDRIRKDIAYLSNTSGRRLILVFEFKKLARTSIRNYEGEDGMRRFIDGNYGNHEPLAAMVAMLKPNDPGLVNKLYSSLSNAGVQSALCMVHDSNKQYVRKPSTVFPNLREAIFDTEHRRPAEKAPPGGTTTLAHIVIEFV